MNIISSFLHALNLFHGPLEQPEHLLWRCSSCGKIADADPDNAYEPYNWRRPKMGNPSSTPSEGQSGLPRR